MRASERRRILNASVGSRVTDLWAVLTFEGDLVFGVFDDEAIANDYAEYLTARGDPAIVREVERVTDYLQ